MALTGRRALNGASAAAAEGAPPMEKKERCVLEDFTQCSKSHLWKLMMSFYDRKGVESWSQGIVPHFITCNSFIGQAYAKVLAEPPTTCAEAGIDPPVCCHAPKSRSQDSVPHARRPFSFAARLAFACKCKTPLSRPPPRCADSLIFWRRPGAAGLHPGLRERKGKHDVGPKRAALHRGTRNGQRQVQLLYA